MKLYIQTLMVALSVALFSTGNSRAANGTWITSAGGLWSDSGNWQNSAIPGTAGDVASFTSVLANDSKVTLGSTLTIGSLILGNAGSSYGWTLSASSATNYLTFDNGSGNTTSLSSLGGNNIITSTIVVTNSTTLNMSVASGTTLTLAGGITNSSATAVNLSGGGTLTMNTASSKVKSIDVSGNSTLNVVGNGGARNARYIIESDSTFNVINNYTVCLVSSYGILNMTNSTLTLYGGNSTFSGVVSGTNSTIILLATGDNQSVTIYNAANLTATYSISSQQAFGGALYAMTDVAISSKSSLILTGAYGSTSARRSIFDISSITSSITIGSLQGNNLSIVSLGTKNLSLGADNTNTTFAGTISGSGTISKVGTGTITISGANIYTGGTTLTNGTMILAGGSSSTTTQAATLANGTLTISGINTSNLTVGQTVTASSGIKAGTFIAAIDSASGTITLSAKATANVSSATLTFSSYSALGTGTTTISGGKLVVSSSNALQYSSGGVFVHSGTLSTAVSVATLGGGLSADGGLIAVGASMSTRTAAILAMGDGKNFSMTGGTIELALGATYDQIDGSGLGIASLTNVVLVLDLSSLVFDPKTDYKLKYNIFSGFSSVSITNLQITGYDSKDWTASVDSNGVLSFVPEPPSCLSLLGGILILCLLRYRRKCSI
jgi:fibronectin-binding autotransporter adhesin